MTCLIHDASVQSLYLARFDLGTMFSVLSVNMTGNSQILSKPSRKGNSDPRVGSSAGHLYMNIILEAMITPDSVVPITRICLQQVYFSRKPHFKNVREIACECATKGVPARISIYAQEEQERTKHTRRRYSSNYHPVQLKMQCHQAPRSPPEHFREATPCIRIYRPS